MSDNTPIAGSGFAVVEALDEDTHLLQLLKIVNAALDRGDATQALRYLDRAWRIAPRDTIIAQTYGQLLLKLGEPKAAIAHLIAAAEQRPNPTAEAAIIEALLASANNNAAVERLDAALRRFALVKGGALHTAARTLLRQDAECHGWIGLTPELDFIGEVRGATSVEIKNLDGIALREQPSPQHDTGPVEFSLARLGLPQTDVLRAVAGGHRLLGSNLSYPPDFMLDGRATESDGVVTGWVSLSWNPAVAPPLSISDQKGTSAAIATEQDPAAPGRHRFSLALRQAGLSGGCLTVTARLPDGRSEMLPDTPLWQRSAIDADVAPARRGYFTRFDPANKTIRPGKFVDVIIPVYRGREETLACIEAVSATIPAKTEIIVVDDASPDRALAQALDALAAARRIRLLRNEHNVGFAKSVNRALAVHDWRDAIVLNADTIVFNDWVDRLQQAAHSSRDIGTATPLTNRGSIASFPRGIESDCSRDEAARLDALAAQTNAKQTVEIPVGVGFCLYIRRDCLTEVGYFDDALFGHGYGEENDFCMRARHRRWHHVLATDVFVWHAGGRSFGRRRAALMERNARLLALRHPDHDALVTAFNAADPAAALRRRLAEARLVNDKACHSLMITTAMDGGVKRFVAERRTDHRGRGLVPLTLRPLAPGSSQLLLDAGDGAYADLLYAQPEELSHLLSLLQRIDIAHIEFHHFLGVDPAAIQAILGLGIPFDVYVHDYVWICPQITFIDGSKGYCHEPEIASCEACVAANGSQLGEAISVANQRRRSAAWLEKARHVIVPSVDTANRFRRYFPQVELSVTPWETLPPPAKAPRPPDGPVRVALIGAIGDHKGYQQLVACARDAAERKLPLEFVVIGYTQADEALFATGKVFVTGRYEETEINALLGRERPHIVLFPTVAPETWCYTLTYALSAGLPIVAFRQGAVAERLHGNKCAILISSSLPAPQINDVLLETARAFWGTTTAPNIAARGEAGPARISPLPPVAITAPITLPEPIAMDNAIPTTLNHRESLAATVQLIDVTRGLYFFAVRVGTPGRAPGTNGLALPAVHVGLGPGVPADQVKFMPGPQSKGTWLHEPGDMLIAKVNAESATLVLTSMRAPGIQPLDIAVERLEARYEPKPGVLFEGRPAPASFPPPPIAAPPAFAPSPAFVPSPVFAPSQSTLATFQTAPPAPAPVKLKISLHVRNLGDLDFADADWAGRVGNGLWIEAMTLSPADGSAPIDLEYKALTASGFETPWLGTGQLCGTRGMAVALVGFAVRQKAGVSGPLYDCEYSGYFQSGNTAGPTRNGAPCRSRIANDPLEGIQLHVVPRRSADIPAGGPGQGAMPPRFSALREEADSPSPLQPAGQRLR